MTGFRQLSQANVMMSSQVFLDAIIGGTNTGTDTTSVAAEIGHMLRLDMRNHIVFIPGIVLARKTRPAIFLLVHLRKDQLVPV